MCLTRNNLYNVGIVEVDSLVKAILAVNCRGLSLKINQCWGQCYDGASNMTGSKCGVVAQIQAKQSHAE